MRNFKYYDKSRDIRNETEKKLDNLNRRIELSNQFSIAENFAYKTSIQTARTAMRSYAETVSRVLPMSVLSNIPVMPIGTLHDIYKIEELTNNDVYSNHKKRNNYLRVIFGKAEYFDSKADAYNMGIQMNNRNVELEKERIRYSSINEKIRVIERLRNLLIRNEELVSKINYRTMSDTQLFDIYAGLKLYETLGIVIGGI